MIRLVAFDLGGVLVDVSMERAAHQFNVEVEAFRKRAFDGDGEALHAAMTVGGPADSFVDHLARVFGTDHPTARAAWASVVSPRPQARAIIDAVAALESVAQTAWSNTDPVHAQALQQPLAPLFSAHRALSFEVEAQKPAAAFFERALRRAALEPSAVLFVDDRAENVAAAKAAGICAVVATSVANAAQIIADHVPAFGPSPLLTESLD